jgi:hypothetical protein
MAPSGWKFAANYERRSGRDLVIRPDEQCANLTKFVGYGLDLEVAEDYKDKVRDFTAVSSR